MLFVSLDLHLYRLQTKKENIIKEMMDPSSIGTPTSTIPAIPYKEWRVPEEKDFQPLPALLKKDDVSRKIFNSFWNKKCIFLFTLFQPLFQWSKQWKERVVSLGWVESEHPVKGGMESLHLLVYFVDRTTH
eukprot:TRINITY_DN19735_c0_g1_i1.p1 TRINITY_DN19735_c0_g1~~TRINITY_DN19735_c0_g1_i1.p1  ORF type:complete len:131 (-),score=27.51 TRINITY_DN19735_c0_g1_i1:150-542(-)